MLNNSCNKITIIFHKEDGKTILSKEKQFDNIEEILIMFEEALRANGNQFQGSLELFDGNKF